jgi:hypothetical protein
MFFMTASLINSIFVLAPELDLILTPSNMPALSVNILFFICSVLLFGIGTKSFIRAFIPTYVKTTIDLTEKQIIVHECGFGGRRRRLSFASIYTIKEVFLPSEIDSPERVGIALYTETKTFTILCPQLKRTEYSWLFQELNEQVSVHS